MCLNGLVQTLYADDALKIWITPPKGHTLKGIKKGAYDWRRDSGQKLDDLRINDDQEVATELMGSNQWTSQVAAADDGKSIVVWEDWRNGNKDIYAQILDENGKPVGKNFRVNDDRANAEQKEAAVTANGNDGFMIVWRDARNGNYDIFGQRVASTGQLVGANVMINDGVGDQMNPAIGRNVDGTFIVVWEDGRGNSTDIHGQRISADGRRMDYPFRVNDDSNAAQNSPKIAFDANGNGIIIWRDFRHAVGTYYGGADIYAQCISGTGELKGSNFMLHKPDHGKVDQSEPKIAAAKDGRVFVVWRDDRNTDLDIFGCFLDVNGRSINADFRINDDTSTRPQMAPAISVNNQNEFVVIWADRRSGNFDVFGQLFNRQGDRVKGNFQVNDAFGSPAVQNEPVIACDSDGNFIVSWTDYRYMENDHRTDIFAQRSYAEELLNPETARPTRNLSTRQSGN